MLEEKNVLLELSDEELKSVEGGQTGGGGGGGGGGAGGSTIVVVVSTFITIIFSAIIS
jgi:bacteriocin-like protein